MADFWLLLTLRVKLALRRYTGKPFVLVVSALAMLGLWAIGVWFGLRIMAERQRLEVELSRNLLGLVALVSGGFLVLNPLLGFRGNEFMDVSKLFAYPIRPLQVFLSSVCGQALSGTTLFLLPILLLPALANTASPTDALLAGSWTLLYLLVLWTTVQCLTLVFLNVLRSRRFRDLIAILGPVVWLLTYLALRHLLLGREDRPLDDILETMNSARLAPWLPPFWYSHAVAQVPPWTWLGPVALGLLLAVLSSVGLRLTVAAFHGEIAIASPAVSRRRRAASLGLSRLLPPRSGALYTKELALVRREPFFRVLFLQQIALVLLLGVGQGLWGSDRDPALTVYSSSMLLVLIETGFLQNILGLEGPAIHHTAQLPVRGFTILAGKNLAHFQVLALVDLAVVPGLSAIGAYVAGIRYPLEPTLVALAGVLLVLPAVIGTGNLVSVLLPNPVGPRGRRALGQDRTGAEGFLAGLLRGVFSLLALVPAALVAGLLALPLHLGHAPRSSGFALGMLGALGASLALWWAMTNAAGRILDRGLHRILERLG